MLKQSAHIITAVLGDSDLDSQGVVGVAIGRLRRSASFGSSLSA